MNKRLLFWVGTGAMVLALALVFAACDNGSTGSGNDDSGNVPAALQGNWLRDGEGTENYLVFTASRWGTDSDSFDDAKEDADWVVTSATADKIEYKSDIMDSTGSFNWSINGTTLTISNSSSLPANGTYTKQ
jgi:hypothetical protein